MNLIMSLYLLLFLPSAVIQGNNLIIEKNKMTVKWEHKNERIHFELSAPTTGWIAIGFNTKTEITGTYLIMGHIIKKQVEVLEHYTISPGNYKSFKQLNIPTSIQDEAGEESQNKTTISFSLPTSATQLHQLDLKKGLSYYLTMAYSRETDFQHHSMMRTQVKIDL